MQESTREYKRQKKILDAEDTIETMDSTVKENAKYKKLVTQNIQAI